LNYSNFEITQELEDIVVDNIFDDAKELKSMTLTEITMLKA